MIERFLEASNFTPEEQALLNEILDADAEPTGINVFDLMSEGLKQALAYARGEIELPSETYEHTFPDCPLCWNMQDNDCRYKNQCIVQLSQDGECRVGDPSKYTSIENGRMIDAFNDIGLVNPISPEELRKIL